MKALLIFIYQRAVRIFLVVVRMLDRLVPKDPKLCLLSAVHGEKFAGNSRFLFEYLCERRPDIDAWFYFRKRDAVGPEGRSLYPGLRTLWLFLRAQTLFVTHGADDFYPFVPSGAKRVVQLWHGVPMRGIGVMDPGKSEKFRKNIVKLNRQCNHVVMPSREGAMRWCSCMGLTLDRVVWAGQPRNDFLLQKSPPPLTVEVKEIINGADKVVLYAPTWRPWGPTEWFPFPDWDARRFEKFLEDRNMVFLLRPHGTEKGSIEPYLGPRVKDFSGKVVADANPILPHFDVLITDYSSIYYDYLLLDRPVIFMHYDYERYKEFYGFLFDEPEMWFPGPSPSNMKGFMGALGDALNGAQAYSRQRSMVNETLNAFQTNDSCRVIAEHFMGQTE